MPKDYYTEPLKHIAQAVLAEPDQSPNPSAIDPDAGWIFVPIRKFIPVLSEQLGLGYPSAAQENKIFWNDCSAVQEKSIKEQQSEQKETAKASPEQIRRYNDAFQTLENALIDESGVEGYTSGILEQVIQVHPRNVAASLGKLDTQEILALKKLIPVVIDVIARKDAEWKIQREKRRETPVVA